MFLANKACNFNKTDTFFVKKFVKIVLYFLKVLQDFYSYKKLFVIFSRLAVF